jgi:DNA polymerase-1
LSQVLNEMSRNSLKAAVWRYSVFGGYENMMKKYAAANDSFVGAPHEMMVEYAGLDAVLTLMVEREMVKRMKETDIKAPMTNGWSLARYYFEIVVPAANTFIDIEYDGMLVDRAKLNEVSAEVHAEIERVRAELHELFGVPEQFNFDSGEQLGRLLEEKGWKSHGKGVKGYYLSKADNLVKWKQEGHMEAAILLEYRELQALMKTFLGNAATADEEEEVFHFTQETQASDDEDTGYYQYLRPEYPIGTKEKVHSTFSVMMADSGRNRSARPNLQNVPKHGRWAPTRPCMRPSSITRSTATCTR